MYLKRILAGICSCAIFGVLAWAHDSNLNKSDQAFLNMAADANMSEAYIGKLAENKAAETGVKDFGQTLVRDHTDAYQSLTILANKVGATIPKGIDVRRDRTAGELMHLKGSGFDHRFLTDEIHGHEKVLAEFRREAEHGRDSDVKAYASKMIPTLEHHLHTAESLAKSERPRG